MPTVGEQLRKARIEKGITIEEISASSHINRQYLEQLEQDLPLDLPTTYVRAFIRSFASAVGLDPAELLRSLTPAPPPPSADAPTPDAPVQAAPPEPEEELFPRQTSVPVKQHQLRTLAILTIVILLGLTISIIYLQRQHESPEVQEIDPELVRSQSGSPASAPVDSSTRAQTVAAREAVDSLTLEAVSVETVYVRVVTDSIHTHEYTLAPQHRVSWKAMHSFRVSVGRTEGIFFTLNGKHLGTLGKGTGPLRDVLLTRQALQPPPATSSKKPNEKAAGAN